MLDKYLVIRQHSKSAPVFTLDIADNYPLPNHIIIENIAGRDTEMGSSVAFFYPQLDQLYLKFLSNRIFFLKFIKIISYPSQFSSQDQTLFYFLFWDRFFSDPRNKEKKVHHLLVYSASWAKCSYKLPLHTKKIDELFCSSCQVWT